MYRPPENEGREAWWEHYAIILLGVAFVAAGLAVAVIAARLPAGTGDTRWLAALGGIALAGLGARFIAYRIGASEKAPAYVVGACFAIALNFAVFLWILDWLRSAGGRHGVTLARIFIVSVDLWLAYFVLAALLGRKRHAAGVAGVVVLAAALQFSGALDRLGWESSRLPAASSGILQAERQPADAPAVPLEAFAGRWHVPIRVPFGDAWITRLEVNAGGGRASATFWRLCPRGECEAGSHQAKIESRGDGRVLAVHFAGEHQGMHWLASLVPNRSGVWLNERHIRGSNWMTHQQQAPQLQRAP